MENSLWNEILEETRELARAAANPRTGMLSLSPETAALLEKIVPAAPGGFKDAVATVQDTSSEPIPSSEAQVGSQTAGETALSPDTPSHAVSLAALAEEVSVCTKCALHEGRTQTVFADGNPNADLVFVGEAPGFHEDQQGIPFVGKSGALLTDIIEKGMKISRKDVYICNVIKCRPPENRDPLPDEKQACETYLIRQLELVKPKVICALGGHAAKTLLRTDESTGSLRGRWHFYQGIPLRVTYHPSYLLRSPGEKRKTWDDILEVMKVLNGEVTPVP